MHPRWKRTCLRLRTHLLMRIVQHLTDALVADVLALSLMHSWKLSGTYRCTVSADGLLILDALVDADVLADDTDAPR